MEGHYLYGIVEVPASPPLPGLGLAGAPVYAIGCRALGVLASDAPAALFPPDARHAARHAAVVEEAMRWGPVLPVRFGTVVRGREKVVAHLDAHHERYVIGLGRVRGKVEMAVKVVWDPGRPSETEPVPGPGATAVATGRAYLLRKLADHRAAEAARARGEPLIARIAGTLRPLAADGVVRSFRTARLLLDAAYLVAAEAEQAFRAGVARLEDAMAGPRFLVTGPWPPYNFVPGDRPAEGEAWGSW